MDEIEVLKGKNQLLEEKNALLGAYATLLEEKVESLEEKVEALTIDIAELDGEVEYYKKKALLWDLKTGAIKSRKKGGDDNA